MAHFLVEFRLRGYAKEYAKWARACTLREARKLGIRRLREPRFVPHITLFGPAEAHNLRNVVREVEKVGRKYTLIAFKLGVKRGEFQVKDANWLYLDIQPSPGLEQFRYNLAQGLLGREKLIYDTCTPYDRKRTYKFHCSIGKYDPRDTAKFEKLAEYAETKCSSETFKQRRLSLPGKLINVIKKNILKTEEEVPGISQHLLRVTVLGRRSRIQSEYDLAIGRMLSRMEALSRYWWRKTVEEFKELRNPAREEYLSISSKSVYLIGDTHFDHKNIIRYCCRPFSSITEMNNTIKNNWNSTVHDKDMVYFLGDWAFGWRHRPAKYWMKQLNGTIVSIRGSHDQETGSTQFRDFEQLHIGKYDFLLIHNPNPNDKHQTEKQKQKLQNWHEWIIHGHVHNNAMDRYPFINGEQKTINISVEVTNYRPVSFEYLLSLDLDSIKRMRTIDSPPERR